MNVRTREAMITFDHPFHLSDEGALPAGAYRIALNEEQLLGLSFVAYRRVATMLYTPALAAPQGRSAILSVDAAELDAALLNDRRQSGKDRDRPSSATAT